jgi:hypothetical protein
MGTSLKIRYAWPKAALIGASVIVLSAVVPVRADDEMHAVQIECDAANDYVSIEPFMRWTDAQGKQHDGSTARSTPTAEIRGLPDGATSTHLCDTGVRKVTTTVKGDTLSLHEASGAVETEFSVDLAGPEAAFVWIVRGQHYLITSRKAGTWSECLSNAPAGSVFSEQKCSSVSMVASPAGQ